MTAYEAIETYLGTAPTIPISIGCAAMSVVGMDGKKIQYGPISGTITSLEGLKVITLDDPGIVAEIDWGMHATVKRIECTPLAAFAMGSKLGIVFRKPINISFGGM